MKQVKEFTQKAGKSVSLKLAIIGILILLMLIPMAMIKDLIRERENRSMEVVHEVSNSWGREQLVTGPYISIPYKTYSQVNQEVKEHLHYAHFLPEQLDIKGKLVPEKRKRGIYEVVVYSSVLNISGSFPGPDFSALGINPDDILWENASINFGVSDMRGIQEGIIIDFGGKKYELNPGIKTNHLVNQGVSRHVKLSGEKSNDFTMQINLNGSRHISFVPLGKETVVNVQSAYPHPNFNGSFIPRKHEVNDNGFNANWKVLHLNRPFPQQWTDKEYQVIDSAFGVELLIPVDQYHKAQRSAKYAIMFIALTFLTFFFIEVLYNKQIHAFHYLLVGAGLVVFYSLLVAISEHLSFNLAYLISSIAIILLITLFGKSLFKEKRHTAVLFSVLVVLYVFLFTILQLTDYALLMGNIGLLAVLAVVMYFSRKIKWSVD